MLSQLLLPGSCATLLLLGCSGDSKAGTRLTLSPDTSLARIIAEAQVAALPPSPQASDSTRPKASSAGSNPPERREAQQAAAAASESVASDTQAQQQSSTTDIFAAATAAPNSGESLGAFTPSETESAEVDLAHPQHRFMNRTTLGLASATIGVGALLHVGGLWNGSSSDHSSDNRTGANGYTFGFNGFHPPHGGHASPWVPSNSDHHDTDGSQTGDTDGPGVTDGNQPPMTATPEPATVVLLATGFALMIPVVRRRRRS